MIPDPSFWKPLSALNEWADNYNQGEVALIARSIRRYGFNGAPRVWLENIVMAGNHAMKALKLIQQEGAKEEVDHAFPPHNIVVYNGEWYIRYVDVSHLSDVEARAFAIADNEIARKSVVDEAKMARFLQDIAQADQQTFLATGFNEIQLKRMLAKYNKVEAKPDAGAKLTRAEELLLHWDVQYGQLWEIPSDNGGTHRLLVGDSTQADDVKRLMNGDRAALFATDPPYLVGYDGNNHAHNWEGGEKEVEDYHNWDSPEQGETLYEGFVNTAIEHAIMPDAAWYCWHASRHQAMLENVWTRHGAFVHQQIIWAKDRPVLTRSWYMWQHEPCLFGWVKGQKPKRIAANYPPTVWQFPTIAPGESTDHPTSKPVELFKIPIEQHTEQGEICYEPFSGSGTQFVAAEQTGRICYGIEKQPVYVAVILQRLADMQLTPKLVA